MGTTRWYDYFGQLILPEMRVARFYLHEGDFPFKRRMERGVSLEVQTLVVAEVGEVVICHGKDGKPVTIKRPDMLVVHPGDARMSWNSDAFYEGSKEVTNALSKT